MAPACLSACQSSCCCGASLRALPALTAFALPLPSSLAIRLVQLPPGWTEGKDPASGVPYYYNAATGE
jgi:hypothetical protein